MTLKLFRAGWFLSVVLVLGGLLYVYAGLPEEVVIQPADSLSVGREWLFYGLMIAIVAVNLLVYLFKLLYSEGEDVRSWFYGLVITINLFVIISLNAIGVYNSGEFFDHNRISFFITGSLGLVVIWTALWPVYLIIQKFLVKEAV